LSGFWGEDLFPEISKNCWPPTGIEGCEQHERGIELGRSPDNFANPAAARLAGMAQEKLLALDFARHGTDQQRVIGLLSETAPCRKRSLTTIVIFNHQQVTINFLPVHDRESTTVVVIIKDISKTKIAEDRLKETKEYLHSVFNSVQAGIIVIDVETNTIIDANPRALELFGITKPDMLAREICSAP
jgi:PAS domain-containing protein